MKIGITEAGDAGIDLSWVEKLKTVDGAILVTKNITPKFMRAVLELFWERKDNFILHITCTGWGGTKMEPNVPHFSKQLQAASFLIKFWGFPEEKVVIRIDPIIPTKMGLRIARNVFSQACQMGFRRFRVSVLDMYPHVRDRFVAAVIAFVINYAAYFSEIFRGGIESIPKGQYEAGQVLGMSKAQIFFKIVLMQVIKRITAPMSNEIITLVKDTSLARIIMVMEILQSAETFAAGGVIWPLFYTGAFFLLFCGVLTLLFGFIEKKLDYYKI